MFSTRLWRLVRTTELWYASLHEASVLGSFRLTDLTFSSRTVQLASSNALQSLEVAVLRATQCRSFAGFALLVPADLERALIVDLVASQAMGSARFKLRRAGRDGHITMSK